MVRRNSGVGAIFVSAVTVMLLAGACGDSPPTAPPPPGGNPGSPADAGTSIESDGGTLPDAGEFDAGTPSEPDAGTDPEPDAGTGTDIDTDADGGTPGEPGPWPTEAALDYSARYGVGTPQSVGVDEGLNLWLLDDDRIGVLRPGDAAPTWTRGVGQASQPWGPDSLALGSTVICGGEAGRAYVGYAARELDRAEGIDQRAWIPSPGEPYYTPQRYAEYQKGDLDVVRVQADGTVALEEHLWRTVKPSNAGKMLGIHNTNDYHWEEDRTVLNCERVTVGPYRGDLFITSNHSVTMVRGLVYNSHRHPGWYAYRTPNDTGSLVTGPMHGVGIAPNGDVLVANDYQVGALVPNGSLDDWDHERGSEGPVPWRFKGYNDKLSSLESEDYWRAIDQTLSGTIYVGSANHGLWSLRPKTKSSGDWARVDGVPSKAITALKATDDGALYIGTKDRGLWRLEADGVTLAQVTEPAGDHVLQLVYEPTVTPSMLLVLTNRGLTVLRGP